MAMVNNLQIIAIKEETMGEEGRRSVQRTRGKAADAGGGKLTGKQGRGGHVASRCVANAMALVCNMYILLFPIGFLQYLIYLMSNLPKPMLLHLL